MGHDAGELGLVFGRLDRSEIDEDRSAGQREGVDLRAGYDVKGVGSFAPSCWMYLVTGSLSCKTGCCP